MKYMKSKRYYGEYTLRHWLDLMLKGDIELPEYQRHFAWEKDNLHELIMSLKNGIYIPPITIGAYKDTAGVVHNYILDGQQRLTSILLAYLGLFPKKDQFVESDPVNLYEDGAETEESMEESNMIPQILLPWRYPMLLEKANSSLSHVLKKIEILEGLSRSTDVNKYETIAQIDMLDEAILQELSLGFSYIVPATSDVLEQQKFYSSVFRGMNMSGLKLTGLQSRRALYYLNAKLVEFFEPNIIKSIQVKLKSNNTQYDFVRDLAFLAEYKNKLSEITIAKGCRKQDILEHYYEAYIDAVVNDRDDTRFGKFSRFIPEDQLQSRLMNMRQGIENLGCNRFFSTIIEADMYMYGLIYCTIYDGKVIETSQCEDIKNGIMNEVLVMKGDSSHTRTPNALMHLRYRIKRSIEIYNSILNATVQS